jgi:Ca2+-binding RTX toxin-like protein
MASVTGTITGERLKGGIAGDLIDGLGGDDTLLGGGGADLIEGGSGNDILNGEAGADTLRGGTGDDYANIDDAGDIVVEGANEGRDVLRVTLLALFTLPDNVEEMRFAGATAFQGIGNRLDNRLDGGTGADTLRGLDGADTLLGGAGDDSLEGGSGADLLNGHAGRDTLRGGTGDDFYNLDDVSDLVIEVAGQGRDTVRLTGLGSYTLPPDVERLEFGGAAAFAGTGNGLANGLAGGAGDDLLAGLKGNDTLDGAGGADTMVGGGGHDSFLVDHAGDVVTELAGRDGHGAAGRRVGLCAAGACRAPRRRRCGPGRRHRVCRGERHGRWRWRGQPGRARRRGYAARRRRG